jgi:probable HAF family extracellular repeat protein
MRRLLARIAVIGLVAAFLGVPLVAGGEATAQTSSATYVVQNLGTLPGDYSSVAMGINQAGDVVGWSYGPTGARAFLYTAESGMTALPALAGRPFTTARAVNDDRTVVGTASTGGTDVGHAVLWQSGTALDLGTLGAGSFSEALAVNGGGSVVGSSSSDGGSVAGIHAFRRDPGAAMVDLTPTVDTARATGINDAGQVAGYRNSRAFRLDGATFTDLGVPTGYAYTFATAINASGQVAGSVSTASGSSERVFRYTDGVGMVVLGGSGEHNTAMGINAAGDVVGQGVPPGAALRQGFLYTDAAGMRGLNSLIDPTAGWFVIGASSINDAGQIAGWASGPNGQRAVRLVPAPVAPPTAPAAPSRLAARVRSVSEVRLTWVDNAGDEVRFQIQRAVGTKGQFALLASVGADATRYTDRTVRAHTTYRYRVRAENGAGVSAWSNTASALVP